MFFVVGMCMCEWMVNIEYEKKMKIIMREKVLSVLARTAGMVGPRGIARIRQCEVRTDENLRG